MVLIYETMSILSSALPVFEVAAFALTVTHLFRVRALLRSEQQRFLDDSGSRIIFSFATHYFFSVFMLCVLSITPESSFFLRVPCDVYNSTTRLLFFCGLAVLTIVFFS